MERHGGKMAIFLETSRLFISMPQKSDIEHLYQLQSNADVMAYIGNGVRTREEVLLGLDKAILHQQKYGYSLGCVYEKVSGEFVGRAGLIHFAYDDTQPDVEVAYALLKSAWGKGYATELAQSLVNWGFEHLSVNKIVAVIYPGNMRSQHVLEKINMQYAGHAKYRNADVLLYQIARAVDYTQS
jgi:RimJ/RimL family protein N-acetyltransferase